MGDNNKLVKFESEIGPLASGDILHTSPEAFTPLEAVEAYAIVKFLADRVEVRRKELRSRIIDDEVIIGEGTGTPSGGTNTDVRGHKVTRKKQVKRFSNVARVKELLKEKGLKMEDMFDEIIETKTKTVVNPSKMEKLLDVGKLTEEEIESCHVTQWSLIIKASRELEEILEIADQKAAASKKLLEFNSDD